MHPNDQELDVKPNLLPCASCGRPKVLKLGDYCITCALDPALTASEHEYVILSPATLDLAVEKSGIARQFLSAKMDKAFEHSQSYVIFKARGQWHDILIHDAFYLPIVMKKLFEKMED